MYFLHKKGKGKIHSIRPHEQQQGNSALLFIGRAWATPLFELLNAKDLCNLASVCVSLAKVVCPFVSGNSKFPAKRLKKLKWYTKPCNICCVDDISQLKMIFHMPSIIHLEFGFFFDLSPKKWLQYLPHTVTHLSFGSRFNQTLPNLPSTIIHLKLGDWFAHPINNLPPSITYLEVGLLFNQPVDNLPPNVTHLILGVSFDQQVNNLPHSLTHLIFGYKFNHYVTSLPPNLTHLTFGHNFNRAIDNLPPTITHLTFGDKFNQVVRKWPPSLKYLYISKNFPKGNTIPEEVEVNVQLSILYYGI